MATCPSCQSQIEIGSEYFGGLFTCPACKAVYFISFDGTPEGAVTHETPAEPIYEPTPPVYNLPPVSEYQSETAAQEEYVAYESPPVPGSQEAMESAQPLPLEEPPAPVFAPLQDVVDYANSDAPTGLSTYSVLIEGIDSAELIQALKDTLTDSKLELNFENLRPQIKNGVLHLKNLNPAQAAVIAFRLRPFPMQMRWEQSLL